jgi:phosphoadenosine phosphosulfate reductase
MNNYTFEEWREYYLLHASSATFRKKVNKAREAIANFLDLGIKSYVSVSGGKDSTAMMHLVWQTDASVAVMSEKDDMDFPGELEYMHKLQQLYNLNLTIIQPDVSLWDIVKKFDFTEDIHSRGTEFSDEFFYGLIEEFQYKNNYKAVFLGLRAEESKGRMHNYAINRSIYYNESERHLVCQPIATWTGIDVMAYLFENEVPILDVYFKTKFVLAPHEIRKSWALPSHQSSKGQALWLKYYYPEIFQKLAVINPKIRSYV